MVLWAASAALAARSYVSCMSRQRPASLVTCPVHAARCAEVARRRLRSSFELRRAILSCSACSASDRARMSRSRWAVTFSSHCCAARPGSSFGSSDRADAKAAVRSFSLASITSASAVASFALTVARWIWVSDMKAPLVDWLRMRPKVRLIIVELLQNSGSFGFQLLDHGYDPAGEPVVIGAGLREAVLTPKGSNTLVSSEQGVGLVMQSLPVHVLVFRRVYGEWNCIGVGPLGRRRGYVPL